MGQRLLFVSHDHPRNLTFGKRINVQSAQEQVGVRDCERPAFAIRCWTRVGTCGFRSDVEDLVSITQDRASPGRNSVDVELRNLYRHSGGCRLENVLI